jgi:hypothetical protein
MPQNSVLGGDMAEETEGSDAGAEVSGAGADPFAAAMRWAAQAAQRRTDFWKSRPSWSWTSAIT